MNRLPGLLLLPLLLAAGCASSRPGEGHYYFQRDPVRVAIIPSANATDEPAASMIFNKACEERLRARGFEVINADRVVTFAASSGVSIRDLPDWRPGRLSEALKADYLLFSRIDRWETRYRVIAGYSVVAGASWLYEGATEALLWQAGWHREQESGNGGGGLLDLLVDAALTAALNTALDTCGMMGADAAAETSNTLPEPGFEPVRPGQP